MTAMAGTVPGAPRVYRYYDLIMAAFVCVLLCANLIGVTKVAQVNLFGGTHAFGAGNLFFPLSYLFGDILTEVYGYARSRRVVWAGFGSLLFASIMSFVVVNLPPADGDWFPGQAVIEKAFGSTWRIAGASLIGYFCGEFMNSFVLAKLKILTQGKHLWMRTIGSTVVGESVDTLVFYPLAFYGSWPNDLLVSVMIANYCLKVGWEVVMTPVTYRVVNALKRAEREDFYDKDTNFTPFSLAVQEAKR
jgi:queuosine precursor transporter